MGFQLSFEERTTFNLFAEKNTPRKDDLSSRTINKSALKGEKENMLNITLNKMFLFLFRMKKQKFSLKPLTFFFSVYCDQVTVFPSNRIFLHNLHSGNLD